MRYSGSSPPGSCLIASKTPPGTNRLIAGLMVTISPTLNLWDGIGFLAFPGDNLSDCAGRQNQPDTPQQIVEPYHALIARSGITSRWAQQAISAGFLTSEGGPLTLQYSP